MPACQYGANTGSKYRDYCKIIIPGGIIGNQGGRQDAGEEALGEREGKKQDRHTTLFCVKIQGLASVLSLSRVKGFRVQPLLLYA